MGLQKPGDVLICRDPQCYCGPGPSVVCFGDGKALVVYYFNVDNGLRFVAGTAVAER